MEVDGNSWLRAIYSRTRTRVDAEVDADGKVVRTPSGDERGDLGAGARGVERPFPHEFRDVLRARATGRSVEQARFERTGRR